MPPDDALTQATGTLVHVTQARLLVDLVAGRTLDDDEYLNAALEELNDAVAVLRRMGAVMPKEA